MSVPPVTGIGPATPDRAETSRLGVAVSRLLPALERFNRYEGADPAARNREDWQARLDRPLPAHGVGLDELLTELAEVVIPHGLRNGAPGRPRAQTISVAEGSSDTMRRAGRSSWPLPDQACAGCPVSVAGLTMWKPMVGDSRRDDVYRLAPKAATRVGSASKAVAIGVRSGDVTEV